MFINNFIKIVILFIVSILFITIPINAEQLEFLTGNWEGTLFLEDKEAKIEVSFIDEPKKQTGFIKIPSLNINNQPLNITELTNSKITFKTDNDSYNMVFKGNYSSNIIKGTLFQEDNKKYNFVLNHKSKSINEVKLQGSEQEIKIPVKGGELAASLTYPKTHNINNPVAILIAGSGPTDRDGNTPLVDFQINNLKNISYFMANNDIISIRYDKRGVAGSSDLVDNKTPTFTQYSNDVFEIIKYVRNNLGRKPRQIFLVGHSEGATLAMMAAQKVNNLGGIVLLSSPGFKQEVLLKKQLQRQNDILYSQGKIDDKKLLVRVLNELIKAIEKDKEFPIDEYNIPDNYKSIYRNLNNQREFSKEWLKTSPVELLKKLDIPTCIIHGTEDQQIGKDNAERLSSVVSKDNLSYNYIMGVNHLLLDDNNFISERLLKTITAFIKKHK
ncbi:MAG: alpha/beta hydrolase [Halanaerobiales bacterium]|nr:alpha/beta hydrolase [Halanaerobiales bacterium]